LALAWLLGACAHAAEPAALETLQRQIRELPDGEVSTRDRQRLTEAAEQLQAAQQALAQQPTSRCCAFPHAGAMSERERVMAEVQLGIATERLKVAVADQGGRSGLALPAALRAADEASASARRASGARRVEVSVTPAHTGGQARALQVYAVPLGVIAYVGTLPEAKLRYVLEIGRFTGMTSPAADQLETGGDYAVWIAEPHRLDDVAQLLRQRGLTSYRKVDGRDPGPISLTFTEAEQVRLPAPPAAGSSR
jgi:hypothetical protein